MHFFSHSTLKNGQILGTFNKKFKRFLFSRSDGVLNFKVDVPIDSEEVRIIAKLETEDYGQVQSSAYAYKTHTNNEHYIHVRSSTKHIAVGEYVVFHVKTSFPFEVFDWVVLSKNIVIRSGREYGDNIHPEVKTFSLVTSPDMAPGFHIVVYTSLPIEGTV